MIVAILFVKAVGFGALAGILSLSVASVGFIGKLFAGQRVPVIEEKIIRLDGVAVLYALGVSVAIGLGLLQSINIRQGRAEW